MQENLEQLKESIEFRFKAIFNFQDMPLLSKICKFLLLIIFFIPFLFFELLGIVCALSSIIPIFGLIISFVGCLVCDLFASLFFFLIMIPHKYSNSTQLKYNSNNKKSAKNESLMQEKNDLMEINHFIIKRFNIEFEITNDFLVDPVMTLYLAKNYGSTQVASFLMKDTDNGFTISYMGKSTLKTLSESTMDTWVNEVTQLGKCHYRKSIDNTMTMYGISFLNNDTYTIAYKHKGVNKKIFDNCIEKIIQTLSIPDYINLEEADRKTLINFCDDVCIKYNKLEYKNFSYHCRENQLTKNILLALMQNMKSSNLGNEYISIIEKYL